MSVGPPPEYDMPVKSKWRPTNKWIAATATGIGTIATSGIELGWDRKSTAATVGFIIQRFVSYMVPNDDKT